MGKIKLLLIYFFIILTLASCRKIAEEDLAPAIPPQATGLAELLDTRATYCSPPRLSNGHVNFNKLITDLIAERANMYSFCIHPAITDLDDLKDFLPLARENGIRVWASILPPKETTVSVYSSPYRTDYEMWATEFAQLSLTETNLIAWSIDDFTHNLNTFTPEYLKKMIDIAHDINPKLVFVPCSYFSEINSNFVKNVLPYIGGILFPYRAESSPQGANLKDTSLVKTEIDSIRQLVGSKMPIIVDVYASSHSTLGATTTEYVGQVLEAAKKSAVGIMIYRHQDPVYSSEKFNIIKNTW